MLERASDLLPLLVAGNAAELRLALGANPVIDDPRHGRIAGDDQLEAYAAAFRAWSRERSARVEPLRVTAAGERAVAESLLHLEPAGGPIALPVALVAERAPDGAVWIRIYHSLWPLSGSHALRPPLLAARHDLAIPDVVGRYQAALAAGDLESIVAQFEPDGSAREPSGGPYRYQGPAGLRQFFGALFANEGGIPLEHCSLTDDGVCCAIEYNVTRWGRVLLPPQAGVAVYERGPGGMLQAARIYDDVEPPLMYEE